MMLTGKLHQVELKIGQEDVTGKMGLGWVYHCLKDFGLEMMIAGLNKQRRKGSNREIGLWEKLMAGALSLIAGATRIEDIEVLRTDKGLLNSLGWRSMISPDTLREQFKDKRSSAMERKANELLVVKALRESELNEFTNDNDATYFDTGKEVGTYSYQKRRQCSGLLGFIAELGMCVSADFRRGHVSPARGILNQLRKAVMLAERAGKRIGRFRSDSAAHQNKVFEYCESRGIKYYISLDKNAAVKECIDSLKSGQWQMLEGSAQELGRAVWCAETVYSTNAGQTMRMLVLRWKNPDPDLFDRAPYRYHAIGTNDTEIEAMAWLEVHNGRMGSENYNKELKEGLNAGYTPSHDFDIDRGYFLLNVLAYNMMQVMKLFYLGRPARKWTIKTLRYWFIGVCGRIVRSGRKWYCKIINASEQSYDLFHDCLRRLRIAW